MNYAIWASALEKASKDFAQLIGVTSEQYSRIEGATLTASNDKLVRWMVIAMSVIEALKEPALMERVANQMWDTGIGPERRIIARVDAACEWVVETRAACSLHLASRNRDVGHSADYESSPCFLSGLSNGSETPAPSSF
jgi:hypothetical protein